MIKAETIYVTEKEGREILVKVDAIPYKDLADCTGFHKDLGFFQESLDPRMDYEVASDIQVLNFERSFNNMKEKVAQ